MGPRRKPSSTRIAAQKLIVKTKVQKTNADCVSLGYVVQKTPNTRSKVTLSVNQTPHPSGNNSQPPSSNEAPVEKNQSKCYGLKITHHGIVRQSVMKKGRRCTCEMCGAKFKNSTLFINHYSSTHPPLACKHCSISYTNPLSLQKHVYTHTADKKSCVSCGKQFAFDSQLADHRKTHMKKKPHICPYPNCTKDFTHRYDLLKHEQTHRKGVHNCDKCDYSTKDVRNLRQHSRTHTGETLYQCKDCGKKFTFYMQK